MPTLHIGDRLNGLHWPGARLRAATHLHLPRRLHGIHLPRVSEANRFLLLSVLIGIFAGLMVVCFHVAIEALNWSLIETAGREHPFARIISPALGALAAALMVARLFPAAKGSGVNDTKAAFYITDGVVPFNGVIGKFLACAVSIGSGNSLGPEDPSLHMGAGVASLLGRAFHLSRDKVRLIAPVGAAAGIAAAFNTPIAAVLFVIEEVVSGWNAGVLGSIVLSSVSSVVTVRWFLGNQPLFLVPQFDLSSASELLVYAAMGVAGGLLSVAFIRMVKALRHVFSKVPRRFALLKPAGAGLAIGIVGLWLPQVMGAGYGSIDDALHARFAGLMLMTLGLAKMMVTLLCFSAGTPGGMFAPTLFTGAMIGGAIGDLAGRYAHVPVSASGAYVLVGMGTFFAGVFRAPMTSIFMVFEVSASYVIILPVMIANTISYLISRKLQPVPFFTMIAKEEGLDLPSLEEQREWVALRVEDAMAPVPAVLSEMARVGEALERSRGAAVVPVALGDGIWSMVSVKDLAAAAEAGDGDRRLGDALKLKPARRVYPDVSLDSALRFLKDHPVVPVATRSRPYQLVGILTVDDVLHTYGVAEDEEEAAPPILPAPPGFSK